MDGGCGAHKAGRDGRSISVDQCQGPDVDSDAPGHPQIAEIHDQAAQKVVRSPLIGNNPQLLLNRQGEKCQADSIPDTNTGCNLARSGPASPPDITKSVCTGGGGQKRLSMVEEIPKDDLDSPETIETAASEYSSNSESDFDDFIAEQEALNLAFKAMMERRRGKDTEGSFEQETSTAVSPTTSMSDVVFGSDSGALTEDIAPTQSGARALNGPSIHSQESDSLLTDKQGPAHISPAECPTGIIPPSDTATKKQSTLPTGDGINYTNNTSTLQLHQANEICDYVQSAKSQGKGSGRLEEGRTISVFTQTESGAVCQSQTGETSLAKKMPSPSSPVACTNPEHSQSACLAFPEKEKQAISFVQRTSNSVCSSSGLSRQGTIENSVVIDKSLLSDSTHEANDLSAIEVYPLLRNEGFRDASCIYNTEGNHNSPTGQQDSRTDRRIRGNNSIESCEPAQGKCVTNYQNKGMGETGLAALLSENTDQGILCPTTFVCTYLEPTAIAGVATIAQITSVNETFRTCESQQGGTSMNSEAGNSSTVVGHLDGSISDQLKTTARSVVQCQASPCRKTAVPSASGDLNANQVPQGNESKSPILKTRHQQQCTLRHAISRRDDRPGTSENNNGSLARIDTNCELKESGLSTVPSADELTCNSSASLDGGKMRSEPISRHYVEKEDIKRQTSPRVESIRHPRNKSIDTDLDTTEIKLSLVSGLPPNNTAKFIVNHTNGGRNGGSLRNVKQGSVEGEAEQVVTRERATETRQVPSLDMAPAVIPPGEESGQLTTAAPRHVNHHSGLVGRQVAVLGSAHSITNGEKQQMVSVVSKENAEDGPGLLPSATYAVVMAGLGNSQSEYEIKDKTNASGTASRSHCQQVDASNDTKCISTSCALPTKPECIPLSSHTADSFANKCRESCQQQPTKDHWGSTRSIYSHLLRRTATERCSPRPKSMNSAQVAGCLGEDNTLPVSGSVGQFLLPRSCTCTCPEDFSRKDFLLNNRTKITKRRSLVLESLRSCDFRGCPCRTLRQLSKSASTDDNQPKSRIAYDLDPPDNALRNESPRKCPCQLHPAIQSTTVTPNHSGNNNSADLTDETNSNRPESCKLENSSSEKARTAQRLEDHEEHGRDTGVVPPSGQLVMTEAMKYTRDKLLHRSKEDLAILLENFKKQSQVVSEELVQLLQDRHELQEQVEMRRIAIEQLLRLQAGSPEVKELNSVQMSVILPEGTEER